MNNFKLFTSAAGVAAICVAGAAAATYLGADPEQDSSAAAGDQMSRQQLWNYAIANAEGFSTVGPTLVLSPADHVADFR